MSTPPSALPPLIRRRTDRDETSHAATAPPMRSETPPRASAGATPVPTTSLATHDGEAAPLARLAEAVDAWTSMMAAASMGVPSVPGAPAVSAVDAVSAPPSAEEAMSGRDPLLRQLMSLERALHRPQIRRDPQRLDALLHAEFVEIGYGGRRHTKTDLLALLPTLPLDGNEIRAQDVEVQTLSPDLVLLTYRSVHRHPDGTLTRFSHRSSLWERQAGTWRLRFHQGTPTQAFELLPWSGP